MERLNATTADGVSLALRRFAPSGTRRGVLLCTHAMMSRGRYFHVRDDGFAGHLAGLGIDVFVLDWRGHGESRPPEPRRDQWCFDDYVELDLPAAMSQVCAAAGVEPRDVTYLGHSLGGLAGLAAIGTGAVPTPGKLSLWATSVWLPGPTGSRFRRGAMWTYRAFARALGYAPIRRMGLGSDDEPRAYVEQLAGWALSGRWSSRVGVDYRAALATIDVPVFAVTGAGDKLCRPRDAQVLLDGLGRAPALRQVGRDHGDPVDPDHFTLFTEPRLWPLWDELSAFVSGS